MEQESVVEEKPCFDLEKPLTKRRVCFDLTPREYELAKRLAEAICRKTPRHFPWRGGVSGIAKMALLDAIETALDRKLISDEDLP